ncbi:MAG TPA: bifunctional riboflavin kinase/FAD synthetase [Thermoanaerobaculia bacterium]|jgi:riboflavin kinase/FMN adenylyltransferase
MQVIHDALKSADLPYGVIATIGNYDGIHRGQQAVIARVVERARTEQVPAVVITFDPHPLSVLRPESAPPLLTTAEQREEVLAALGVDVLLLIRFNRELARTSARDFVVRFLHRQLALAEIYVGESFVFGHERRGDLKLLGQLGDELGFKALAVPELAARGEVISSTRIRRALAEGRTEEAMELLGRPYELRGTIVRGDRMGMRLGWPTINLMPDNELRPCDGVYTGQVRFPSLPAVFDCVTNVGTRPTVYESYQHVVESHVLDFSSDVYGERAEIRFFKRLREEKMFPTVMDLSAQIGRDVEATREYFAAQRRSQEGPAQ